ncbi:DNA-directed RNA polymerase III subunit RPC4, partial [Kipferlia bialata]
PPIRLTTLRKDIFSASFSSSLGMSGQTFTAKPSKRPKRRQVKKEPGTKTEGRRDGGSRERRDKRDKTKGRREIEFMPVNFGTRGVMGATSNLIGDMDMDEDMRPTHLGGPDELLQGRVNLGHRAPPKITGMYPTSLPFAEPDEGTTELRIQAEARDEEQAPTGPSQSAQEMLFPDRAPGEERPDTLFVVQLPPELPSRQVKLNRKKALAQAAAAKRSEKEAAVKAEPGAPAPVDMHPAPSSAKQPSMLSYVPAGLIGKIRRHRSGRVSMVLGDYVYDITPGAEGGFAQDVMVMDDKDNKAYNLGAVNKKLVVSVNLAELLK